MYLVNIANDVQEFRVIASAQIVCNNTKKALDS